MTETAQSDAAASGDSAPKLLTFLIADVRGYTRFTVEHGDEAAARLASRFAALAEDVVGRHEGEVIELRGDEALCVFSSARNALRGSVALQAVLGQSVADDPSLPLTVGMGLDAGEAIPVRGGYRGGALNLAARLCSIAGAGEILASEGVMHLARKTEGLTYTDRGEVTLKGLSAPVRVLQIALEGELPESLPPLQPILVTHPTNLPDDPTPFIGRAREIDQVTGLLRDPHIRMLTLTGPGGTGKTRLALQVGNNLLFDFHDGVFFVSLASLTDPALVPSAIAEVLGVKEEGGRDLSESVSEYLEEKHLLLVLDNFEHLLDACEVVARLLDGCRELHVLVTSRTPLHLTREHEYAVPPLAVPDPTHMPDLVALSKYEAVTLFIDRARAVKADFLLTADNAPAVAEICSRLDGLPLALELAAARIKLFPPQAILQRLSGTLMLLTGGARDRPTRQQTLRGAIDWSYSLLTEEERTLFARLSVFAGGCTYQAADAVCNGDGDLDLLEGMTSLVDKSLVRQEGEEEPRFSLMETIREYAGERLRAQEPEIEKMHHRHMEWCVAVAETAADAAEDEGKRLAELDLERGNLRGALRFARKHNHKNLARLVTSLAWYWDARYDYSEGRLWLDAVVALGDPESPRLRADVLRWAGEFARTATDHVEAERYFRDALDIFTRLDDRQRVAESMSLLAANLFESGKIDAALPLLEQSTAIFEELGDGWNATSTRQGLGVLSWAQGDYALAARLNQEALEVYRRVGNQWGIWHALSILGYIARDEGRFADATDFYIQALRVAHEAGDKWGIAFVLEGLACVAGATSEAERAARLDGAAAALREAINAPLHPMGRSQNHSFMNAAREQINESQWLQARNEGRYMTLEQAIAYASEESV